MKLNFYSIKNDVYREEAKPSYASASSGVSASGMSLLDELRSLGRKKIVESKHGDISSFNFSRDVFSSGDWSSLSKLARGLFIDTKTGEIVARGYEKFFNYKENGFNTDAFLMDNLEFPVVAYKKYNGFLGLVGVFNHKLLFCSKSQVDGPHAKWLEEIFCSKVSKEKRDILAEILDEENLCLVLEVIDPENDPHIVKYSEKDVVLLSCLKRTRELEELPYEKIRDDFAKWLGIRCKEAAAVIEDKRALAAFIAEKTNGIEPQAEGYVLEDAKKYQFKLKGKWYKTWKFLRSFVPRVASGHQYSTSGFTTPLMNNFLGWMKSKDREWLKAQDIITLRDLFYQETGEKDLC